MSSDAALGPASAAATLLVVATLVAAVPLLWIGPAAPRLLRATRAVAGLALLVAAAVALVPDALERAAPACVLLGAAAGAAAFFGLDAVAHRAEGRRGERGLIATTLGASALHKLADGLLLGVAVAGSPEAAMALAFALALHEVPHEMGTYALLVAAGLPRRRALALKLLVALAVYPGAAFGLAAGALDARAAGLLLAASAGGFAYVGGRALAGLRAAP